MRKTLRMGVWLAWAAVGMLAVAYIQVGWLPRRHIVPQEQVEGPWPVAIVFGAAVYPGGRASPILADRVGTAVALYHAGKVAGLLLSGDNRFPDYNEPAVMAHLARQWDVPEKALALDYAGRRTYDTCWRARFVFGVQRALLVTQRFHLPRALYLCRALGIEAIGVPADRPGGYRGQWWFAGPREVLARLRAWWDVHLWPPSVVGGAPEPLPWLSASPAAR